VFPMTYASAATAGQPLYPAANGQVTATAGSVPSIGKCATKVNSVASGAVDFVSLTLQSGSVA
jgi:hypothetical protein